MIYFITFDALTLQGLQMWLFSMIYLHSAVSADIVCHTYKYEWWKSAPQVTISYVISSGAAEFLLYFGFISFREESFLAPHHLRSCSSFSLSLRLSLWPGCVRVRKTFWNNVKVNAEFTHMQDVSIEWGSYLSWMQSARKRPDNSSSKKQNQKKRPTDLIGWHKAWMGKYLLPVSCRSRRWAIFHSYLIPLESC